MKKRSFCWSRRLATKASTWILTGGSASGRSPAPSTTTTVGDAGEAGWLRGAFTVGRARGSGGGPSAGPSGRTMTSLVSPSSTSGAGVASCRWGASGRGGTSSSTSCASSCPCGGVSPSALSLESGISGECPGGGRGASPVALGTSGRVFPEPSPDSGEDGGA